MGAWGTGILQNDTSAVIHDDYTELLVKGESCAAATCAVQAAHAFEFNERDCAADAWLAIAESQWRFGKLQPTVLRRVERIASGWGQDLWREATPALWRARQRALSAFLAKVRDPPRRPRVVKPAKPIAPRAAAFDVGDCLAVQLSDSAWGAAIVTGFGIDTDLKNRTVTTNVIAQLDYHSRRQPTMPVFQARRWLKLTHSNWGGRRAVWNIDGRGFKAAQAKFVRIGTLNTRRSDPANTDYFSDWNFGDQILLERAAQ